MLNKKYSFSVSKWLIVVIGIFWLSVFQINKPWQKNQITNDVVSYYGYLPATFIYHDLSLKFIKGEAFFADKYWPHLLPNDVRLIKMSMGLSMMYAPFFFVGHLSAPFFGQPQDGYSQPYQVCLLFSCLFYLMLGLFYLRKTLLFSFSEKITSLTIFSVYFGTNLLWYSTNDGLMSHGYLFCLLSIFIYHIIKWHKEPQFKRLIYIGLIGGLLTLVRPTMIVCFLFFILFNVYNKQTVIEKIGLFRKNIFGLIALSVCFLLVQFPQLLYWKYVTGHWLVFSYIGERFYFNHPHIIEGLIGFRKGWLIYTPLMSLSFLGLIYLYKYLREYFYAVLITFLLSIFVIFSWWCWWYGGSFGQRPMVDFYAMLALPIASFYRKIFSEGKILLKALIGILVLLLVTLNLYQTKQFSEGLIHYDSMTKESYVLGFFAKIPTGEWYESLDDPYYDRIRKGKPETISLKEITKLKPQNKICLKAANLRNITCDFEAGSVLEATKFSTSDLEQFSVIYLSKDKLALKVVNGKFVCFEPDKNFQLIANRIQIGAWETFEIIYLGHNNKIALKAGNGKYVSLGPEPQNYLMATADSITKKEMFKLYILEQ